jgi:two-component system, NtrC family, response regulator AtoC
VRLKVTSNANILLIDDDQGTVALLKEVLEKEGYAVGEAKTGREALTRARALPFDVVLADLRLPDLDGIEVLRVLHACDPELSVIVMTAFGSMETAVEAIRAGAYDYISKPFNLEEVRLTVRRACERRHLLQDNRMFRQALREKYRFENIVGTSPKMVEVYRTVARVASTRSTVLLVGESGTGKELIAQAIHYNSPRAGGLFVAIDCGALPDSLLESELFGHEKGAFTGAQTLKKGLFEVAHGGTVFLDEVGDISPSLQAKLLRVLQEHEVRRIGGVEPIKVDIRIITATRRDLEALVKAGTFREDLFYRLSVVAITLPLLRERREDIPLLAMHFLRKYASEVEKNISHLAPEAMALLCHYDWPGNVRELEHVIERAVTLTANPILLADDLPSKLQQPAAAPDVFPSLEEMEKRHIQQALEKAEGNKNQAATLLGVSRRTLYRMVKRHRLRLR